MMFRCFWYIWADRKLFHVEHQQDNSQTISFIDQKWSPILTVRDHLVSGEEFHLFHNPEIDMLITSPQPPARQLFKYYQSDQYISHTDKDRGLLATIYQMVKKYAIKRKLALIKKRNGGIGKLLDIGAGTGDFLAAAKKVGWQVDGVEPNRRANDLAKEKGLVLQTELETFQDAHFDVVTLWHVLEHIPNLEETVAQLSHLVRPGGTLIIAVPNFKSYDAKYYGQFWAAYDVPRHLWHFSQKAIRQLFRKSFSLEMTKPLWFDSFYVSLLSEKYKMERKFSVKGLWIGLISNCRAIRTKEYSSLIYCFRKV